jgi:hypothetical protein
MAINDFAQDTLRAVARDFEVPAELVYTHRVSGVDRLAVDLPDGTALCVWQSLGYVVHVVIDNGCGDELSHFRLERVQQPVLAALLTSVIAESLKD